MKVYSSNRKNSNVILLCSSSENSQRELNQKKVNSEQIYDK